ncbi:MAG: zinc-ribbon domain-containing protein [Gammaproteobacteria bacterium]|nr:zinc-ribbon domain-containing protein [Gammaproteobacteria bacterium]
MQIRCPECNTLFKVRASELTVPEARVQCGHCFNIFKPVPEQEIFQLVEEVNTDDIDINTFGDSVDNTSESDELPAVEPEQQPFFSQNPMIDDLVPPKLRQQTETSSSALVTFIWSVGIIALLLIATAQLVYFNRTLLASKTELRPYMFQFCALARCEIADLKDINRIELSSKNVYSHPNVDNALMITAVIVNQAAFAQKYPALQISFTNLVGDIVMARQFKPSEYLNTSEDKLSDMQPGLPVQIILEVLDPGKAATAYEFSFI